MYTKFIKPSIRLYKPIKLPKTAIIIHVYVLKSVLVRPEFTFLSHTFKSHCSSSYTPRSPFSGSSFSFAVS